MKKTMKNRLLRRASPGTLGILKERNAWIFNNEDPSAHRCNFRFKAEFALVIHRAKGQRQSSVKQWLENLP
jgi:hypothetical protein